MYEINTWEELQARLDELRKTDPELFEEYTEDEIIEDGVTMWIINPEVFK